MTRSQATPISSQMMTMERMISERDYQLAELSEQLATVTKERDELVAALKVIEGSNAPFAASLTAREALAKLNDDKKEGVV